MVMERGEVWWAELPPPKGSGPGFRRPVVIVQCDAFNRSKIQTVIAAVLTSNLRLADAPGNVLINAKDSGLPKDSVVNISQVITVDKTILAEKCGRLPSHAMRSVDEGLRLVLAL
jgi:mRNA interferase MazF